MVRETGVGAGFAGIRAGRMTKKSAFLAFFLKRQNYYGSYPLNPRKPMPAKAGIRVIYAPVP